MIVVISWLISVAVVVLSFSNNYLPWIAIGVCDVFLLFIFAGARSKKYQRVESLSNMANSMIEKYGHFYVYPNMSRAYSGAAASLMFCGVIVGGVNAYNSWWYGILLLIVNWMAMGYVSRVLNPIRFFKNSSEMAAHNEVIRFKAESMGIDFKDE